MSDDDVSDEAREEVEVTDDMAAGSTAPEQAGPTGRRKRRAWLLVVVFGVAIAVLLGILTGLLGSEDEPTITGTFALFDDGLGGPSDDCFGLGGYDDIESGLQVVVKDEDGKLIGTRLGVGDYGDGPSCTFPFTVDVKQADFYEVTVGSRGSQSYSRKELADKDWTVSFTLAL